MIKIRKNEPMGTDADGTPVSRMEIDVDNADELPVKIKGVKLGQGSIGWCINDKAFYGINSEGEWINQGE